MNGVKVCLGILVIVFVVIGIPSWAYAASQEIADQSIRGTVENLIKQSKEGEDWEARRSIFEELVEIGEPAVQPLLTEALKDEGFCVAFKKYYLARLDEDRLQSLMVGLSEQDKLLLLLLYFTNQSIHPGWWDQGLEFVVKRQEVQRGVAGIFSNLFVIDSLPVLDKINPDELKKFVELIVCTWYADWRDSKCGPFGDGNTTWAARSLQEITKDIRLVELAMHSVEVRLLVQEGLIEVPRYTVAEFTWSRQTFGGGDNIQIGLPPLLWGRDDIPKLEAMLNSQFECYRNAANKALSQIKEDYGRLNNPEEILKALKGNDFGKRYRAFCLLNEKEISRGTLNTNRGIPLECVPYIKEEAFNNQANWWTKELAFKILVELDMSPSPTIGLNEAVETRSMWQLKAHFTKESDLNKCLQFDTFLHRELSLDGSKATTPLHVAALYGYKDIAELLLTKGANVNVKDEDDNTALHKASSKRIAELLLSKGADVNAKNRYRETPLYTAIIRNHRSVTEIFLSKGADINVQDIYGHTPLYQTLEDDGTKDMVEFLLSKRADVDIPLHCAVFDGRKDIVEFLLSKGANINSQDTRGRTLLHEVTSAYSGRVGTAELLLSKGVDINAKDVRGYTPLQEAVERNHKDVVEFLLSKDADADLNALLRLALAQDWHKETVDFLVSKGADVNIKDEDHDFLSGATLLHEAILYGTKNTVTFLLSKGADINAKDVYGRTPLDEAIQYGRSDIGEFLLSRGADANLNKLLLIAIINGRKDTVEFLISKGADVNTKDVDGSTPLYQAASKGHKDIVEFLLSKGADINAQDIYGRTPAHQTVVSGTKDMAEFLLSRGAVADFNALLCVAIVAGRSEMVKLLVSKGADVNAKTTYGSVPLHIAFDKYPGLSFYAVSDLKEYKTIVEILLSKGADVNAKDVDGSTPLHQAASKGHKDIVEFLLSKGADINAKNNDGHTPLYIALDKYPPAAIYVASELREYMTVVEFLLSKGADVNIRDAHGNTPLHQAASKGNKDMVEFLLSKGVDVNAKNNDGYTPLHYANLNDYKETVDLLRRHGAVE